MIIYTKECENLAKDLKKYLDDEITCIDEYNNQNDDRLIFISKLQGKKADKKVLGFISNYENFETKFISSIIATDKNFHYGHFYIEKHLTKNGFIMSHCNNLNNNIKEIVKQLKDEEFILDKHHFLYSLTYKIFG